MFQCLHILLQRRHIQRHSTPVGFAWLNPQPVGPILHPTRQSASRRRRPSRQPHPLDFPTDRLRPDTPASQPPMPLTPLPPPNRPNSPVRVDPSAGNGAVSPGVWGGYPQDPEEGNRPTPWHRYRAALHRYRWLVLAGLVLGAAFGYSATRFVVPEYESHGTIWISHDDDRHGVSAEPLQPGQLLNPTAWDELFRSLRITDSVVLKERLYLS